ncbi:hypothetical protein LNP74_28020 [Klebsiella pneumoniae subsp. pneumoniae]|nr:hypothetical protein [Klebsiella pneumoniae subsp. pneumoniae]
MTSTHFLAGAGRQPEFTLEMAGRQTELPGGRQPVWKSGDAGPQADRHAVFTGNPATSDPQWVEDINGEHPFGVERVCYFSCCQRRCFGGAESKVFGSSTGGAPA